MAQDWTSFYQQCHGQMFIYDDSTGQITGQGTDADDPPTGATICAGTQAECLQAGPRLARIGLHLRLTLEFGSEKWDATTRVSVGAGEGSIIAWSAFKK